MKKSFYDWCIENDKRPLLAEWHYEKNENLDPKALGYGSQKKVWWIGRCNHQWMATVKNRSKGTGCPICYEQKTGRKLVQRRGLKQGINDFATEHPELLKEWDFNKNESLVPSECMSGSRKKVWWICSKCAQSYQSSPSDRIRGRECPNELCRKEKQAENIKKALVKRRGSLLEHNPELAIEWHPSKNGELTPENISPASDVKVWWLGACNHEWQATPSNRVRMKSGCPICSNKVILIGFNDLTTTHKELCEEWDYEKNSDLSPTEVVAGTHKRVWWLCKKGHSFKASISNRSKKNGTGCPECDIERKSSYNEKVIFYYLKMLFIDAQENYRPHFLNRKELDIFIPSLSLAIEYDGEYYHKDVLKDITKNELCKENEIDVIRIREPNCPVLPEKYNHFMRKTLNETEMKDCVEYIIGYVNEKYRLSLVADIDLSRDRPKIMEMYLISEKAKSLAFMNPDLSKDWHPTKNGLLIPENISYSSNKNVWWLGQCGHEWEAKVNNRFNGNGCPKCYENSTGRKIGHRRSLRKGINDLATENPALANQWHPIRNGDLLPSNFLSGSHKKVWWLGVCGHEWEAAIGSRDSGVGCPYCSNKKVLEGFNDIASQNPILANEWHPTKNGDLKATDVILNGGKKVWWFGKCEHEWQAKTVNRNRGTGCPIVPIKRF
ncbi:zinc-ribbon domain-containing protein [Cytobacillus kochii]|uniref:zinc-ribbon domain-containing protein n=1 Tax=Cytobacillus kochii TaxID=859143 RepID=UPI00203CA7F8|nr:zinc-ribbon domain-containing protein [Cytobacillus kochii]MCM3323281.1 zinc-ribbon domain-containing protein [Cytobacillus kochii]MCM3345676.1 zinc-ribbon domain-containing protein [Cytobacillus kochii]